MSACRNCGSEKDRCAQSRDFGYLACCPECDHRPHQAEPATDALSERRIQIDRATFDLCRTRNGTCTCERQRGHVNEYCRDCEKLRERVAAAMPAAAP